MTARRPPTDCPVCGHGLAITRLSCASCGTEMSGAFSTCEFCALGDDDREVLRIFLSSRGNMKALERHLGVSYPTARTRFDALLGRIGITTESPPDRMDVLESLSKGEIDIETAIDRLT